MSNTEFQKIASWATMDGFHQLVREKFQDSTNMRQAYEKAEETFQEWHGRNRYADYDSYRISRLLCRRKKAKVNR